MGLAQRPIMISPRFAPAAELIKRAQLAEELGVDEIWLEQQPDQRDALIAASNYLTAAPSATVGTAVLPVYARHPVATAQAALTLADFSDGRFILGLGFSHQFVNEYILGYQQGPPIGVMREYLRIIKELIRDGKVIYEGRYFTARAQYVGTRRPIPIFLAALRPQMIRLAVRYCDGIVLWLCGPRFIREHITPVVERACEEFGRDPKEFRVVALLPTYAGKHTDVAREEFAQTVKAYRLIPVYRFVLDMYGAIDADQLCLIGSEAYIQDRMAEFRDAGAAPVISPICDTLDEFGEAVRAAYGIR